MPPKNKKNTKGGLTWNEIKDGLKSVGKTALTVAPLALSAYKLYKGAGDKKLRMKDAPKNTPAQLKPWMRVVETVRADPKYKDLPYTEQLKVAKKIYDRLKS